MKSSQSCTLWLVLQHFWLFFQCLKHLLQLSNLIWLQNVSFFPRLHTFNCTNHIVSQAISVIWDKQLQTPDNPFNLRRHGKYRINGVWHPGYLGPARCIQASLPEGNEIWNLIFSWSVLKLVEVISIFAETVLPCPLVFPLWERSTWYWRRWQCH